MPEIPQEAVQAAAAAIAALYAPSPDSWEREARAALEAALPHLALKGARRPRMACPVCRKEVVRRDDGRPTVHYAKNNNPQFSCKGDMFSHCRGGCRCRKHR